MADRGHVLTDQMLSELEDRIADEYAIASRDMQKKLREYMEQFEEGRKKQKALLDDGKITKKDYEDWVYRHTMVGKRWDAMLDVLTKDMEHASEIALKIARGEMPDVYALNANYGVYQIEHDAEIDMGFTLYNHDAAERLLKEQDLQLMPGPSTRKAAQIAADESMQWNRQKIQSAVFQGIVQGESPYEVSKRLRSVATMNYNAFVRYARTMTTNAQNAGRYEAFRRAEDLGVDLTIEWQATLDGRTRHDHRLMHGQRRAVNEPFITPDGFYILWPAQTKYGSSDIPQRMIWNCRCTLLSWVKGFEPDTVTSSPKMGDMTFEEWLKAKSIPDTVSDRAQFIEYKKLLGKDAPKYYTDFQRVKYTDPEKWEWLKDQARMERTIRKAPCVLTKQKFTRFFLNPNGKHSADFFGVGYTENDVRMLRYDIARQFSKENAAPRESEYGIESFDTIMQLGVSETGRFVIGWIVDKEGDLPRIVTGFRRELKK